MAREGGVISAVASLLTSPPVLSLRGTTTVVSIVLRVGRLNEAQPVCARILLDGSPCDVQIKGDPDAFYDEAKRGTPRRIKLDVQWFRDQHGIMRVDPDSVKALEIDQSWAPSHSKEVAEALSQAVGLFEDADELLETQSEP
jgi:hypothetical protein